MEFISLSEQEFNTIHANDVSFFDELDAVIQREPLGVIDDETRGLLSSIGIRKGTPFAPDDRMRALLTDAVAVANGTARAIAFKTHPTSRRETSGRSSSNDPQTRSELQTGQSFPSKNNTRDPLAANPDGSITLTFGPTEPDENPGNWIQTVSGKKWFTILRLYGPLEPWFDQTWVPGDIEPLDTE
jgi:hypothetical protein